MRCNGGWSEIGFVMTGVIELLLPITKLEGIEMLEHIARAITLAEGPTYSSNSKRIDVRPYFLRESVGKNKIVVEHLRTKRSTQISCGRFRRAMRSKGNGTSCWVLLISLKFVCSSHPSVFNISCTL